MDIDKHDLLALSSTNMDKILPEASIRQNSVDEQNSNEPGKGKRWYGFLFSPLWLFLLVALLIRIVLIVRTHGVLDGDEALVGIQAERILQGNFPIYFYGIPYFGSLEAYLAAPFVALLGPSVWALRLEATLLSLVLVALTWRLASLLAEAARLPRFARRCFTAVAALVAAVPPLYDGIVELRTWGGWIEVYVLMLLLLIAVFRLTSRWRAGASGSELAWRWAGIGLVVGLGMWVYPLITTAIVAAALWIIVDRAAVLIKLRQELPVASESLLTTLIRSQKKLLLVVTALPACLLGFFPGLIWGATHQWANIAYIRGLGGTWSIGRLHTVALVTEMYSTCVAPRVISGSVTFENSLLSAFHSPILIFNTLCIFGTLVLVASSLLWPHPMLQRARRITTLPALFGICAVVIYCLSSVARFSLISCGDDDAGRYATPLMLALPFFLATIFTLAGMFFYEKSQRSAQQAENTPGAPSTRLSTKTTRQRMSAVALGGVLVLLLAYLGGQVATYGIANPDAAFQSPYCIIGPANYDPIIAYMQREHIQYAWASNLLGEQIVFKTDNKIIVADPLPLMHPTISINRIPAYTDAVQHADRPSFLVFVRHGDPRPALLRALDAEHVTYQTAFFPSEPGVDVMVVTPLSRTVSPLASESFDLFYCATR